jgi:DNA invertase Pin-like site-specific DNA recombinase
MRSSTTRGKESLVTIFQDKVSTRVKERTGLLAALDYLRAGDTLCVWKLDRLGILCEPRRVAGHIHRSTGRARSRSVVSLKPCP